MSFIENQRFQSAGDFPTTPNHPKTLASTTLHIDAANLAVPGSSPVPSLLYAGFIEHLGRCIYGGICDDYRNPSPKELLLPQKDGRLGWRKDIMELLKHDGELETPMLRWPGGNFVSNYHWQDAIGPIEGRKKMVELAWLDTEPNLFGTDEFIEYCRAINVEPYICLNMGTGSFEEALAWVEYCNGKGDTHWANLRRKNGHEEPYNVKYWGLGNEMWGPWQVGFLDAPKYAERAKRWAHGLKLLDPTIKLVTCGNTGSTDWDREVLAKCLDYVDLHSIHFYSSAGNPKTAAVKGLDYEKNVFSPTIAENNIKVCRGLIDMCNSERNYMGIPARNVKICFDEWNVWDEWKAPPSQGVEQHYDYADALGFCAWLNLLVRHSEDVPVACLAQSVNVIAPIMARPDGFFRQSIFYPLQLFSKYMKDGHVLQTPKHPDVYTGPTNPVSIQQMGLKPQYVDMVAMRSADSKSIRLSILNRHPTADVTLKVAFGDFKVGSIEKHELYHNNMEIKNTFEEPENIKTTISKISSGDWEKGGNSITVKKHSWVFLMFNA